MILVLDDEPLVLDVACRALSRAGFSVAGYHSAEEARRFIEHSGNTVDLIVIDIDFPLLGSLRSFCTKSPLVVLTAWDRDTAEKRLAGFSWRAIITKPYTASELVNTVESCGPDVLPFLLPSEYQIPQASVNGRSCEGLGCRAV